MYLIFHYANYYPYGGMGDYKGEVDVCTITDGKLVMIGNVSNSIIDAIGVGGWLRELQKKEQEQ